MSNIWSYFFADHEDGTCHQCNGSDIHCTACGGTGFFEDYRTLEPGEEFEVIHSVQSADSLAQERSGFARDSIQTEIESPARRHTD